MNFRHPLLLILILCLVALPGYCQETEEANVGDLYDTVVDEIYNNNVQYVIDIPTPEHNFDLRPEGVPNLEGVWMFVKRTTKRHDTGLIVPIKFNRCSNRFPYDERDFEREVVIHHEGKEYFSIRPLYANTYHSYDNPFQDDRTVYVNYGFKGVVDPENVTFAYTLKDVGHLEHQTLSRQLMIHGKLFYEKITRNTIAGSGYEIIHSPECTGFLRDEIEFELRRIKPKNKGYLAGLGVKGNHGPIPTLTEEQSKDATPLSNYKDTAKPNKNFDMLPNYAPLDSDGEVVPGMW